MDVMSLTCQGLIKTQGKLSFEDIGMVVAAYEEQVFEDGYYKNGPTLVEFSLDKVSQSEQEVTFYIPVNSQVEEGENFSWLEEYHIERAVRERVPFLTDLEPVLMGLKGYLVDNQLNDDNRLLLAFIKVYDDYWVDIILPFKETEA